MEYLKKNIHRKNVFEKKNRENRENNSKKFIEKNWS